MEVYFNLLRSVDPLHLKLTRYDDEIYSKFRELFPDLKIDLIDEAELKSAEAKEKWRPFCKSFMEVEDYNFGTMLRIDSSQEYADENTLLVPRIQFYAIEIARNREGCNNHIRFEFKSTESTVSSLLRFLQHGRGAHPSVRWEDGSLCRGDISVFIKEPACEKVIQELSDITSSGWPMTVKWCKFVPPCRLQMTLDRPTIIKEIITEVCLRGRHYGCSSLSRNKTILIVAPIVIKGSADVTHLRTHLLALHLSLILQANGYDAFLNDTTALETSSLQSTGKCTKCNLSTLLEIYEKSLQGTFLLEDRLFLPSENSQQPISLKCGEKHTKLFYEAVKLEHLVQGHVSQEPDFIIHVVPETEAHFREQVGYVWNKLSPRMQMYVVHGKVLTNQTTEEFQRHQMQAIKESVEHRCADKIENTPILEILADTAVKFKLLSVGHSSLLNLEKSKDRKVGVFVQYNCARLSMIFQRFEDGINKNIYHSLPPIECVDYDLLKQEEWQLLYKYVLPFPQLVSEALGKMQDFQHATDSQVRFQPRLHKISHMLQHFINEVSHYYSKKQILVDCRSDLMAARLRAMQAVQTVVHNALWLLQVVPLERI